ncbi:hypothetical protein LINGRAHAP2_LOCUS23798 [Linum grandiflorum]
MGDDYVEMVWHFGGKLVYTSHGSEYEGGDALEIGLTRDVLNYQALLKVCIEDLYHKSVDRLCDSVYAGTGYEPIVNGERNLMGENDSDEPSKWEDGYRNESDANVSDVPAHVGIIHVISYSDKTSDSEFLRAMENMGLSPFRRRVRTPYYGGYEVDQINKVVPRQHNQEQEVIVIDEGGVNDMDGMHLQNSDSDANDEDSDYDVDKEMALDSTEEDNDTDNSEDCEGTDNMYYHGSTRKPEGSSAPQVMDVQGSQPPRT